MNRNLERRLRTLEEVKPGNRPFTQRSLLESARRIRAGGDMPQDWASLFTPAQILRMAELQVGGEPRCACPQTFPQ